MTISTVDNRALFRLAVATLFVLAFPLLFEVTFSDHVREGEYNSRLGWTFILLLSAIVFQKRWLHIILLVPFIIGGSIDIGYAINFGGVFTTATVEALINTDISEVTEYGATYSSPLLFSVIAVYWTLSFLLLKGMSFNFSKTKVRSGFIVFGALLTLVAGHRITVLERYHDTIPGVLGSLPSYYKGHIGLQQEIDLRKQLLSSIDQDAKILNAEDTQTYIFFIGESINRNHMSVYGYHRTTTPKIDAMANKLIVFNDVISSHAQTNASLRVALTQATADQGQEYREALSIIDIANHAGFKTWWISNQQPVRATLASIAAQANETQFISNDYQGVEVNRYDGFMLPYIEKALNDSAKHKAIFVHMMGSHAQYSNRYPEAFEHFSDNNVNAYEDDLSANKINTINEYDNSIRYTDHVIEQAYKLIAQDSANIKALTLLSDHGEEVFDSINIKGHSPDNVTADMLEIPMLSWLSEGYKERRAETVSAMMSNREKSFRLDNFYHFAADLMGIRSVYLIEEDSLSSSSFLAPSERQVYNKSYERELKQTQVKQTESIADKK